MKTLTIAQVEDSGERGSVWVLNRASASYIHQGGDVVIGIPKLNGNGGDPLVIPQTWLPTDACATFPRQRVMQSSEFRGAVLKGLLVIIPEDEAEKLYRKDGAAQEQARLNRQRQNVSEASAARTINSKNVQITRVDGVTDEEDTDAAHEGVKVYGDDDISRVMAGKVDKTEDGFDSGFMIFFDRLRENNDMGALNDIRNRARFTRKELRYMAKNLPNHPKCVKAIKDRISEFKTN